MSIVLKDGTVLPDIPAEELEIFPYVAVIPYTELGDGGLWGNDYTVVADKYVGLISTAPCIAIDISQLGLGGIDRMIGNDGDSEVIFFDNGEWSMDGVSPLYSPDAALLMWSNHDIMKASFADDTLEDLIVSTEVYFPSSVKPEAPPEFLCETYSWFRKLGDEMRRLSGTFTQTNAELVLSVFNFDAKSFDINAMSIFNDNDIVALRTPTLTCLAPYALAGRTKLKFLDLAETPRMHNTSLWSTGDLATLILRSPTVCTIEGYTSSHWGPTYGSDIYYGNGYVYVPANLVNSYKSASGWSKIADQFRAIEDYPEICNQKWDS